MKFKGYLYIMAAAALWGILGPFSRLAFSEGLSPMEVAFWRAMLAWGFFGVHALATQSIKIKVSDLPIVALFAFTGITLFYATYQLAVREGAPHWPLFCCILLQHMWRSSQSLFLRKP